MTRHDTTIHDGILQAIIDGPTTGVERRAFPFRHLVLTQLVVPKLPRASGTGVVRKRVEEFKLTEKWGTSSWAKKLAARKTRSTLTDFERFGVMIAKKQRRDAVRKTLKKEKASS